MDVCIGSRRIESRTKDPIGTSMYGRRKRRKKGRPESSGEYTGIERDSSGNNGV
jgi:hypothetical protein